MKIIQKATVVALIYQAGKEFELRPAVPHEPMSVGMRERGTVVHTIVRQLIDALVDGKEDDSLPRVDTDEAPGIASPKKASMASPRRIQVPSHDDTR